MRVMVFIAFLLAITSVYAAPTYSGETENPTSPTDYAPGKQYNFSIEWASADTVFFEHNFTGSLTNTTVSGTNNYNISFSDRGVGLYQYRWLANDTGGEFNTTDVSLYDIRKISPDITLEIESEEEDYDADKGENVIIDGSSVQSISLNILANFTGTFEIVETGTGSVQHTFDTENETLGEVFGVNLSFSGNQNYTSLSILRHITINDTTDPTVSLSLSEPTIEQEETIDITYSSSDNDEVKSVVVDIEHPDGYHFIETEKNGTITYTNTSVVGTYTVDVTVTDENNNTASETGQFTVEETDSDNFVEIQAGENHTFEINNSLPINSITITPNVTIRGNIIVSSDTIPSVTPNGVVNTYFKIQTQNFTHSQIDDVKIVFEIPISWMEEQNITAGTISLQGRNDVWTKLSTEKTNDTLTTDIFTSTSNVFYESYAITGDRPLPDVVEPPAEPEIEPEESSGLFWWIIAGLVLVPAVIFAVVKRRALKDFYQGLAHTIDMNLKRMRKPDPKKVTKKLSQMQDKMWQMVSQGKDMGEVKINIDQAAISLRNDDVEAAEFYLYEAEKLLKSKK